MDVTKSAYKFSATDFGEFFSGVSLIPRYRRTWHEPSFTMTFSQLDLILGSNTGHPSK